MTEIYPFLKSLISASGVSAYEAPVRRLIQENWRLLTDDLQTSRLGSLHGLRRGTLPEPRPSVMLAAHMDAIGLIVTGMVDGFLHVARIGGLDVRVLPGQLVTVHGREDLPGVIAQPPADLLPPEAANQPVSLEYLLIDVGLLPKEVERLVRVGDPISFAQPPVELSSEFLAGHSLDNRASVAALTVCLEELQGRQIEWDLWSVATVQEEVTLGGAATSAFQLHPSLAIAVDVTHATGPGSPAHSTFPLGKGITLGWGPNIHPALCKSFEDLAKRLEIPYKLEVMPGNSGTDAIAMQVAAEGIPTMLISIPVRYMHTPVEVVSMKDILRAGRLMAEFVAQLDGQFLEKLAWQD